MLSTKEGHPIAIIKGNPRYSTINLVGDDEEGEYKGAYTGNDEMDIYDMISEDDIEEFYKSKRTKRNQSCGLPDKFRHMLEERKSSEFHIKEGALVPCPNISLTRDVIYVAGPSGSGKSTYIGQYLKSYRKTYPDRPIFILSKVASDDAFDKIGFVERIPIDEALLTKGLRVDDFKDSCVVFDDIDTITNKVLCQYVQHLRDDCMEIGRHSNVSICATSHQILDYTKTRTMVNESQQITVFPKSGSTYQIKRLLRDYCGFTAKETERALKLPSRWITIHKNYPCYVMYSQGVYMKS